MAKKKLKGKAPKKATVKKARAKSYRKEPEVLFDRGIYWNPHVKKGTE